MWEGEQKDSVRRLKNSLLRNPCLNILHRSNVSTFAWETKWFDRVCSQTSRAGFARSYTASYRVACRNRHPCIFQHLQRFERSALISTETSTFPPTSYAILSRRTSSNFLRRTRLSRSCQVIPLGSAAELFS